MSTPIHLSVDTGSVVKPQGDLFGLFFEDINHAADGGLYAEMVQNRSFEFDTVDNPSYNPMTAWQVVERGDSRAVVHVEDIRPLNDRNRRYAHVEVTVAGIGGGIRNLGFDGGIAVDEDETYRFSCFARLRYPYEYQPIVLVVQLENDDATAVYTRRTIRLDQNEWQRIECELTPTGTDAHARLAIFAQTPVSFDLDMVSLFPEHTFHDRPNGLRRDLATMIADMKPKFMRFPGGCVMHIGSMDPDSRDSMYRWKNTLGPVEERGSKRNSWNYNSTFGLGYLEYFQFCEDIGAEPMPVVAGGWDPHFNRMAPMGDLQDWIDEALDLVEFADGDITTVWGARRAELGHPEPFNLNYLGIGNEETGDGFFERYQVIADAVHERYPDIHIVGTTGQTLGGPEFDEHWKQAKATGTALMDEHYYQCPEWFIANADRYDSYPVGPREPKAFLGEYASEGQTWGNALAEAAFMTGLEKAPALAMACYAPMLCHVAYSNWEPDMIYFDNHRAYGTPSYYVQKLFMTAQGTDLLAASDDLADTAAESGPCLNGLLRLTVERSTANITDFNVTDRNGNVIVAMDAFTLTPDDPARICADLAQESYEVTFNYTRPDGGNGSPLRGNPFGVEFARHDDNNYLRFQFDGWHHMSGLYSMMNGKPSAMQITALPMDRNTTYRCRLKVDVRHVQGWIDDRPSIDYTVKSPKPKPLYYSAVRDADAGEIIVKVVNVEAEAKTVTVDLKDFDPSATGGHAAVDSIVGVPVDAVNSFEQPEFVSPKRHLAELDGNTLTLEAGPQSLHVIHIRA